MQATATYTYRSAKVSMSEWSTPEPLTILNTYGYFDSCPALSLDEHWSIFASGRPEVGCGGNDIYVSRRQDRRDDFGWEPPVNVNYPECDGVNSALNEQMPTFYEDEAGKVIMYFISNRAGGSGSSDIYQSEMRDDNTFGPVIPVSELNSSYFEQGTAVRRDGLEIIFLSSRPTPPNNAPGAQGNNSFWRATRESTADPWSELEFVPSLNSPDFEAAQAQGRISLSFDGCELYFTSNRAGGSGGYDIWVAKREKLKGKSGKD